MARETAVPTKITADDAWGRFERDELIVFVDSRNAKEWAASDVKLPGAIRVPADDVEAHLDEIPRDRSVVAYCTCPHEASSGRVAEKLAASGFTDVHPLYGGFAAWRDAGYPLEPK